MKQTSRGKADNKIKDTFKVGQKEEVHFLRHSGKMSLKSLIRYLQWV